MRTKVQTNVTIRRDSEGIINLEIYDMNPEAMQKVAKESKLEVKESGGISWITTLAKLTIFEKRGEL